MKLRVLWFICSAYVALELTGFSEKAVVVVLQGGGTNLREQKYPVVAWEGDQTQGAQLGFPVVLLQKT